MKIPELKRISIVGGGPVGLSLARSFQLNGFSVDFIIIRDGSDMGRYPKEFLNMLIPWKRLDAITSDVVFICVNDDALPGAISKLAGMKSESVFGFAHCSGWHGISLLEQLKKTKTTIAAFHPVKPFPKGMLTSFEDCYIDIQTEDADFWIELAKAIKANPFIVSLHQKKQLHIAAAMASNFIVTVLHTALQTQEAKNDASNYFSKALVSLADQAVARVGSSGSVAALTGPIARGDVETILEHVEMLKSKPEILKFYTLLGLETVALARLKEGVDLSSLSTIENIFKDVGTK